MRTDVKLGIALSAAVVSVVGGYFLFRDSGGPAVALNDNKTAVPAAAEAKPATAPSENRSAKARPNPPANAVPANERKAAAPRTNVPGSQPAAGNSPPRVAQNETRTPASAADAGQNPGTVSPAANPRVATNAADPAAAGNVASRPPGGITAARAEDLGPQPAVVSSSNANQPVSDPNATGSASRANEPVNRPGSGVVPPPTHLAGTPAERSSVTNPNPSAKVPTTAPVSSSPNVAKLANNSAPGSVPNSNKNNSVVPSSPVSASKLSGDADPKTASSNSKGADETHRIQPGDSLASLSQNYYGSEKFTKFLLASNPQVRDPNRLSVGTVLKIPPMPDSGAVLASPSVSPAPVSDRASAGKTYRVQPGDTFYSISKSTLGDANRWKELFALNRDVVNGDATQLQIGQVLKLPER